MPVSLVKKIIRGHPYWYARECQRVGGKPKIVWQKYLGKADDIVAALGGPSRPPKPREVVVAEFGGAAALYDLTQRLDLIGLIDRHAGKREQGVSVGTYITLAAVNRCLAPTCKTRMAEWYQGTVLRRLMPISRNQLTSQRFWDHMSYLDAEKIAAIEEDITRTLIERFQIDLACLLYDTTNFYTFIDSFNEAPTLAQRGHSKEKRTDLRIVGLALVVTQDFHIPLFHRVYAGNLNDTTTFKSVTETLVNRYRLFTQSVESITVVYDKGNNSQENQERLDASDYHFVGSLSPSQHADLIEVPRSRFRSLSGDDLEGVLAYRTRKKVLGALRTLVVTYNPELFLTQSATIMREAKKRSCKLRAFQIRLAHPAPRSKPITMQSAQKQIDAILTGRHMKDLFKTSLQEKAGTVRLQYEFDRGAWRHLQSTLLGINILFTDQDGWSDEAIVRAYRGQYHIEEAFKRMKNPHFVSWRPLHHWTDQKIRVHAFYCVLALLLSSLLRRTLAQKGIELSIVKMLDNLSRIKELAIFYRGAKSHAQPVITYTTLNETQQRISTALGLDRFRSV